ncbi:hypothetical protein [Citrobacter sp. CFSAN044567]|uniref:hypothetical protein n=1 Tax=Citrobacter sp. CFSAN044567 TaxID=1897730 RepID=UPI00159F2257|nr:hypothetical protein [Citrobacter sp. CFSAN044567]HBB6887147.1 hypothetical protein [Citrobacter freundii]
MKLKFQLFPKLYVSKGREAALPVPFSRKFSPVNPPAKSQISRSAPSLLTPSKILTDIFRTANNLSVCKEINHVRAGCASMALAIFVNGCDHSSIFE